MRVVNASPLIHLARLSLLDLLREPRQSEEVIVPAIVFEEVMKGAKRDPTACLVDQATHDWLTIVPTPPPRAEINPAKIDAGEIAVLSVALITPGSSVVLDDLAARMEADRLGIPKTGTLRLLPDAKELGILPSVRTLLERLRAQGMRLSDAVWREVLSQAGEQRHGQIVPLVSGGIRRAVSDLRDPGRSPARGPSTHSAFPCEEAGQRRPAR